MRVIFQYQVYKNNDNQYTVCKYKNIDTGRAVTCTGIDLPTVKIPYNFTVEEEDNKKYGRQYKVIAFTEDVSNTETDIVEYLSSKLFAGIGKAMAGRIYEMFGDRTLDIIDRYPDELLKVKGISQAKLDKIIASYKEHHKYRDIMAFLTPFSFNANQIIKICDNLGETALCSRIHQNPYIICDVKGFTFEHAERFKTKFGISDDSVCRVRAAAKEVIKRHFATGCVSVTKDQLLNGMNALLRLKRADNYQFLWRCVKRMIEEEKIKYRKVDDNGTILLYFYLPNILDKEKALATQIMKNAGSEPIPTNIDSLIDKHSDKDLDDSQRRAVKSVFSNLFSVITGGAGVGKTTVIKTISGVYSELYPDQEQIFLAPTGRAARRMTESTGKRAYTIHSRLNLVSLEDDVAYTSEEVKIKDSLVVVDEFSMVDMLLALKLLQALNGGNKVVLVGDPEQLMSVGIGSVLHDIIRSRKIPVSELTTEHRQKEGSVLISNANRIRRGETDICAGKDFEIIPIDDSPNEGALQALEEAMVEATIKAIKKYGIDETVCLSPYKKYIAGVISLNKRLQDVINPVNPEYLTLKGSNDVYFRPGDRVMHLVNDYEHGVMNGDIGKVLAIEKEDKDDLVMYVQYLDESGKENIMEYRRNNIEDLQLAYACTVHKAQGSEYKAVITCCSNFHRYAKRKNLLYTAITRAKEHVTLLGNMDVIAESIENCAIDSRNTMLSYDLVHYEEPVVEKGKEEWVEFPATTEDDDNPFEQLCLPL